MKPSVLPLGLAAALAIPSVAMARPVTVTAKFANYGGFYAYAAVYVTDPQGQVVQTLRLAGSKMRYYRSLPGWARGGRGSVDGVTGASIGSGGTLSVTADVADAMIDAGYQVRIDTAVEDGNAYAADAAVPLAAASVGKPSAGHGYVKSLTVSY